MTWTPKTLGERLAVEEEMSRAGAKDRAVDTSTATVRRICAGSPPYAETQVGWLGITSLLLELVKERDELLAKVTALLGRED